MAGQPLGEIGSGILVFVAVGPKDQDKEVQYMAEKIVHLRIFADETGKMNYSLLDTRGEILIISQFTLYGDCRRGRRPSFTDAAPPDLAEELIRKFIREVQGYGVPTTLGKFGATMEIELTNDGPVTLILDTKGVF